MLRIISCTLPGIVCIGDTRRGGGDSESRVSYIQRWICYSPGYVKGFYSTHLVFLKNVSSRIFSAHAHTITVHTTFPALLLQQLNSRFLKWGKFISSTQGSVSRTEAICILRETKQPSLLDCTNNPNVSSTCDKRFGISTRLVPPIGAFC